MKRIGLNLFFLLSFVLFAHAQESKYRKPVVALAGGVTRDAKACNREGITAYFPIVQGAVSLKEAMKKENAEENMADTAEQVYRLFSLREER